MSIRYEKSNNNLDEIKREIEKMARAFNIFGNQSQVAYEIAKMLDKVGIKAITVIKACDKLILKSKKFPAPSEFYDACIRELKQDDAVADDPTKKQDQDQLDKENIEFEKLKIAGERILGDKMGSCLNVWFKMNHEVDQKIHGDKCPGFDEYLEVLLRSNAVSKSLFLKPMLKDLARSQWKPGNMMPLVIKRKIEGRQRQLETMDFYLRNKGENKIIEQEICDLKNLL